MRGLCVFGLAYRIQILTAYDVFLSHQGNGCTGLMPVRVRWHKLVFDSKESCMVVVHLHNDHAQNNGAPRQGFYKALADCCAGGVRMVAGDMNMAFWGLSPEVAALGLELRLIANHGE